MTKKVGTKATASKTTRSKVSGGETCSEITAKISRDVLKDILLIIHLKDKGVPRKYILSKLKISRSTYQRRLKLAREINSIDPTRSLEIIRSEIGGIISTYKMITEEAMKMTGTLEVSLGTGKEAPIDPQLKAEGFRIALRAYNDLGKFLRIIGFFEPYKAEQNIKAGKMLKVKADKEMQENIFQLMEENQMLRESLEAARNGKPEPHDLKLANWQSMIPSHDNENSEPFEANTKSEMLDLLF